MGPLTYSLQSAPAGATIDSETGAFTWTPDSTQFGTWSFAVVSETSLSDTQDSQGEEALGKAESRAPADVSRPALNFFFPLS